MGTQLGIRRLTGAIGAEVSGISLNSPLNETTFEDVHQAFLEHCLLVFRGQFLMPAPPRSRLPTVGVRRW